MNHIVAVYASVLAMLWWSPAGARTSGPRRAIPVDMVVIHATGGPGCDVRTGKVTWARGGTLEANIAYLEHHPVLGIHYIIDRNGVVRASIPEGEVANHIMGYSERSIGIELVNDGDGVEKYPEMQLRSLVDILRAVVQRYKIRREGVKRHSDLDLSRLPCDQSRRRKVDPGKGFPFDPILDDLFSTPILPEATK